MKDETMEHQVGGNHYLSMGIQPWEIVDANNLNYYEGCVLKYIMRRKDSRIEDLKKAIHCIEHLIEMDRVKDLKKAIHCIEHLIEMESTRNGTELPIT